MENNSWKCSQCSVNNLLRNNKCVNCGCFRSKALIKKGEWKCNRGHINFPYRDNCFKCKQPKPNDIIVSKTEPRVRAGDWYCPDNNCKKLNFGNRIICFECERPKLEEKNKENEENGVCVICMERQIDTCIKICGHLGFCFECSMNMNRCPICRVAYNPDIDLQKVYKV